MRPWRLPHHWAKPSPLRGAAPARPKTSVQSSNRPRARVHPRARAAPSRPLLKVGIAPRRQVAIGAMRAAPATLLLTPAPLSRLPLPRPSCPPTLARVRTGARALVAVGWRLGRDRGLRVWRLVSALLVSLAAGHRAAVLGPQDR